jgi:Uma2 family endonuclease
MPLASPLTIDDFERLPDALALNHELVDGELVDVSGNTWIHNDLRDYLISLLRDHVKKQNLGRVISEQEFNFGGNAHGPDIAFLGPQKMDLPEPGRRVQPFVPDLAIEIVSDNDTFKRLIKKADRYRRSGTQEVWILDLDSRRAFVFSANRNEILDENQQFNSPLIAGFSIRIADLFDRR